MIKLIAWNFSTSLCKRSQIKIAVIRVPFTIIVLLLWMALNTLKFLGFSMGMNSLIKGLISISSNSRQGSSWDNTETKQKECFDKGLISISSNSRQGSSLDNTETKQKVLSSLETLFWFSLRT
jgi:hypothetical protein